MRDPSWRSELNTPAEMAARFVFLLLHAALAAGVVLSAAGLLARSWELGGLGALALGVAGWSRHWLRQQGELEPSERAMQAMIDAGPPLDDARVAELIALLERWEALEQKRGSPQFDPWAVQAVRCEIRGVVEQDPALEHLFTALTRA